MLLLSVSSVAPDISSLKKERKDITGNNCLKGDNGELLVSEEQVSGRWREYFEKLLNEENEWNDELSAEYVGRAS